MESKYRHGQSKQVRRGRWFWRLVLIAIVALSAYCYGWYQGGEMEADRQKDIRARAEIETSTKIHEAENDRDEWLRQYKECRDANI